MLNKASMNTSKCIGETEEYAYGYKHGLSAGIFNTLACLENNGYINGSEFWELKQQIEISLGEKYGKETEHKQGSYGTL